MSWVNPAFAQSSGTNFCSTLGGTRGSNLFALDGTFGTAPSTTQDPTLTSSSQTTPTVQPLRYQLSALPGLTSGVDSSGRNIGTTTYTYNTRTAVNWAGNYSPEDGEYEMANSTYNRQDGAWHRFIGGDNGGGNRDLFMTINASFAAGVFYQQNLTVTSNTNYEFSISIMNLVPSSNSAPIAPNVNLEIDRSGVDDNGNGTIDEAGEAQVIALTGDMPKTASPTWVRYGGVINSGASSSITVRFRNNNGGGGGNDLAIDNLQFTSCTGLSTGSIAGNLYYDANNNGTLDSGESGSSLGANINVELVNPVTNVIVATAQTNSSGAYSFSNIPAGTYTVRPNSTQLNGATPRTPASGQLSVTLPVGGNLTNQNLGYLLPRLSVSKSVSVTSTSPGSTYTYTITVQNTGNANATTSRILDTLPAGVSYVANSATLNTTNLGASSYPFGSAYAINSPSQSSGVIAAGATATIAFQVRVNDGASPPSSPITNSATSTFVGGPGGSVASNTTSTPVNFPDLTLTKADTGNFTRGSTGTYTITINNIGTAASSGTITVSDILPSGLTYSSNTGGWSCSGSTSLTCTNSTAIAAGSSSSFNLVVNVGESTASSITNTATVSGGGQTNTANDSGSDPSTVVSSANLAVTKTDGVTSINAGSSATYTIRVTNNGPSAVTGAILSDPAATGLSKTSVACSATPGQCTAGTTPSVAQLEAGTYALPALTSGQFYEITLTASVTATSGSVTNTATVAAPSGVTDPTPSNNSASDTDTVTPTADLSITKTDEVSSVNRGSSTTYTIRVTNNGPSSVTGAILSDPAATGLSKTSVACSATPGQCVTPPTTAQLESGAFALPALASGQFYEITLVVNVTATSGNVTNTATIAVPSGTTDSNSGNNSASDTDSVTPAADLSITKTNSVTSLNAGSSTTYTIRVTNNGPSSVTGAILSDPAATGLSKTSIACSSTPGRCTGGTTPTVAQLEGGSFALPSMNSGQFYEITLTVSLTATSGSVTNSATIATPSGTNDPNSANNTASDTDTVNPVANLSITKTNSLSSINAGSSTTYTIRVTNGGPSPVTGAILSDPAATGLSKTLVTCSGTPGQCTAGTVPTLAQLEGGSFALPTLASGQFYEILLTASVSATSGSVTNTATVAAPSGTTDSNSANNTASDTDTVNPVADLVLTKTNGVSSVGTGSSTTYTIRVTNNGPSAVTGAFLSDPAVSGLSKTSVACSSTPGQCVTPPSVAQLEGTTFALPALASGQFYEITLVASVTATSGSITNTATVAVPSGTTDPTPINNSASDIDTVTPSADLSITKTNSVTNINAGTSTTYTIRVTNNGPSSVTGAILSDPAATGLSKTSVSCSTTPGQCSTAPSVAQLEGGTFALPALASGQFYEIRLVANLTATTGSVTNSATVAAPSGTTDPNTSNNTASDTDTVNPVADLSITKTNSLSSVNAGSSTTYTIRVTNSGPSAVTGAILSDPAASGLSKTSVACSATPGQCSSAPSATQLESGSFTLPALASGQFYEITLTASVTATSGSITNTATVAVPSGTTDSNTANNSASDTDTVNPVADLAITKTNSVGGVTSGSSTTYTIRITNNGPSSVTGAILSDPAATGLSKTTVACSATPGQCSTPPSVAQLESGTFTLPTLASGQFYEITLSASVTASSGSVTNTATVAVPSGTTDSNSTNNSASDTDSVNAIADLSITKTNSVTSINAGGSTTYTIRVTNNGPSAVTGAILSDPAATGLSKTSVACSATPGQCSSAPSVAQLEAGTFALPALASGQFYEISLTVSVSATSGSVTNTATVAAPAGVTDSSAGNNSASDTDTVNPVANLSISKTNGVSSLNASSSTTYTIRVTNGGPSSVTGAILSDPAATGLSKTSVVCSVTPGQCTAGTTPSVAQLEGGSFALPALASGQFYEITVNANVTATSGSVTNTATVAAPSGTTDPSSANNSASDTDTIIRVVNLSLSKTDSKTTTLHGDTNSYTITVSNSGPSGLVGGTLTDVLPSGLTGSGWSCVASSGGSCTPSGSGNISDTVNIPSGGSLTYTLNVTVGSTASGTISNTVNISVPSGTTNTGSSSATDTTNVLTYTLTKSVNSTSPVLPGTTLTYTISFTNTSLVALTGVTFTDPLPSGTAYYPLSASLNGGAAFGTTYPFSSPYSVGTIAAGASATISFKVVANSTTPPTTVSNQGTVSFTGGPSGGVLTDDPSTITANDPTISTVVIPSGYFINYEDGTTGNYNCTTNSDMDWGGINSSGTAVGRSQVNAPLNGLYHLVSGDLSSSTLDAYTETPWLLFDGSNIIEFRHKISDLTTTNARMSLSLVEAGTNLETVLTTYTYIAGDANTSKFVSQATSVSGVYKVRIRFLGTSGSGSSRGAVDDINTDATQATVTVGTAASPASGAGCNYRLDPKVIKSGPASVDQFNTLTYTITATNSGPATFQGTLTDTVPANLTSVSWVCVASGDADCDSNASGTGATGSGNTITLTNVRIRPGSGNSITLTVTATATTAGSITNTATLTLPSGATDNITPADNNSSVTTVINAVGVTVSGRVYQDLEPNNALDGSEDWSGGVTVRVNLVQGSSVLQSVTVNAGTGAFSFSTVVAGSYQLVVTNTASNTSAAAPSQWVFIQPQSGSLSLTVATSNLSGQNFGLYRGYRLSGTVFRDDGLSGGSANNALQDGGEAGVGAVGVTASDGSNSKTATTDASGAYSFYIPSSWGSLTLSHTQNPATGTNVAGSSVQLASTFNAAAARQRIAGSLASGASYSGYNFGVVWASELRPDQSGQTTSPGIITYRHLFRPGTLGTVSLNITGGLAYQVRRAANCTSLASSDALQPFPLSFTVTNSWPTDPDGRLSLCELEVAVLVPAGRPSGSVDIAQPTASLTWANSSIVDSRSLVDTTTTLALGGLRLDKVVRNVTQNNPSGAGNYATNIEGKPGDTLEYCITYRNSGSSNISNAIMSDPIPFFTNYTSSSLYLNSTNLSDATDSDAGELVGGLYILVRLGTLAAGQNGTVCYRVTIR